MLMDADLIFSDAQAETTAAAHNSDNVIDTGVADGDVGEGRPVYAICTVNTTFTSGGAATLTVKVQHSDDNSTWVDLIQGPSVGVTFAVAGANLLNVALPATVRRYLKMVYTIGTAAMTAGKVDAYLSLNQAPSYGSGSIPN